MEDIQKYRAADKEQDHELSLKFIGLISVIPVFVFLLLACICPYDEATVAEQNSIKAKQPPGHPDAKKDRKRVPLQPLEGLSAQEKHFLFCYAALGRSLRALKNGGQQSEGKRCSP